MIDKEMVLQALDKTEIIAPVQKIVLKKLIELSENNTVTIPIKEIKKIIPELTQKSIYTAILNLRAKGILTAVKGIDMRNGITIEESRIKEILKFYLQLIEQDKIVEQNKNI